MQTQKTEESQSSSDQIHSQDPIQILIADNSENARKGLRALLSTLGITGQVAQSEMKDGRQVQIIGEAANGRQAVQLVEEHHPEVVIMDARMPVMDGLEATKSIKQQWPEIRVIMLTTYQETRKQAIESGADIFLIKGCPPEDILQAVIHSGDMKRRQR